MDKRRLKRRKMLFIGATTYVAACMIILFVRSRLRNMRDRITYGPIEERDRIRIDYLNNKIWKNEITCTNTIRLKRTPFFQLCEVLRERSLLRDTIHVCVEEITMSATCGDDSSASKPPKRAKISTDDDLYSFMTTGIERLAKAIEKAGTADTDVPEDLWDNMMDLPGFEAAQLSHYYAHLCENVSLARAFNKLSFSNKIIWVARIPSCVLRGVYLAMYFLYAVFLMVDWDKWQDEDDEDLGVGDFGDMDFSKLDMGGADDDTEDFGEEAYSVIPGFVLQTC